MSLWQAVVVFLVSAAVLVRAGASLAGYADQIAERMRMSRLFVGTLMLAFATSLPELVTVVATDGTGVAQETVSASGDIETTLVQATIDAEPVLDEWIVEQAGAVVAHDS